jgi:hypothetical protein
MVNSFVSLQTAAHANILIFDRKFLVLSLNLKNSTYFFNKLVMISTPFERASSFGKEMAIRLLH